MKTGNVRDYWHPEFYAGMIAGVGLGVMIAGIGATYVIGAGFYTVAFAFGCILTGSTLATNVRRRRMTSERGNSSR